MVRGVKRVRMEVSAADAAGDMEVRLVVLAILKCEREWVLARVRLRVRKRGGTGASCKTSSGAGERNEAVSAYESRSGCGNANGRESTREQKRDVGTVTIGVRAEAQISIIRCISNTQLNTLCDASYKHHNNRETLCTLSR